MRVQADSPLLPSVSSAISAHLDFRGLCEAATLAKSNIIEATLELVRERERRKKKTGREGRSSEKHRALKIRVIYFFLKGGRVQSCGRVVQNPPGSSQCRPEWAERSLSQSTITSWCVIKGTNLNKNCFSCCNCLNIYLDLKVDDLFAACIFF